MPRKATAIVFGLLITGCIVAIVTAQDSTRRSGSSFKVTAAPATQTSAEPVPMEPGLMPLSPSDLPSTALPASGEVDDASEVRMAVLGRRRQAPSRPTAPRHTISDIPQGEPTEAKAPALAPAGDEPQPLQPAETEAAPEAAASDAPTTLGVPSVAEPPAGSLRSVLKRSRSALIDEAQPPAILPESRGATENPTHNPLPRRPLNPSAGSVRTSPTGTSALAEATIQDLAISGRSPHLRVDVVGPQAMAVGKPAGYVINLINEGDVDAGDVQVRTAIPGFVTVTESEPTSGRAQVLADVKGSRLVWSVPQLAARSHQTLRIKLTATEGQAFDFAVEWACRPSSARAAISVKQPRLDLSLAGPADMTFGEEKLFTLTVSNPGSGAAENVSVSLSSGAGNPQLVEVGTVPAGQQKEIPIQVVATQSGEMELRATAKGHGGLTAEASGKVLVKRAELAVTINGPPLKYAGTEATYAVTVANRGNAAAEEMIVSVNLPNGARYIGGIAGATPSANSVKWNLNSLAVGAERTFEVHCQLNAAGVNRLTAQATARTGAAASGAVQTQVEAVADLKLVVNDPAGASPVGEDVEYELQVMNRGTQSASGVRIVMQFSEGIEPVEFSGGQARIVPGQVVCEPLAELEAGEQVIVKVKARAARAGTHQYRVEVTSGDADTRAVSEGSSKFYADASPRDAGDTARGGRSTLR